MSDVLVIVSLLTVKAVVKTWLDLFEDIIFFIPIHIFFYFFNVFLKKPDEIKLFTLFSRITCILCGLPFLQGPFNIINFDRNWFLIDIDFCKSGVIQSLSLKTQSKDLNFSKKF